MRIVGDKSKHEICIDGLSDAKNNDGWVPHLAIFDETQSFQICRIINRLFELYGRRLKIKWN